MTLSFNRYSEPLELLAPAASFTRPNDVTAYASGDLVANSTTAGNVVAPNVQTARTILIRRGRLRKSAAALANASFRVHLYAAAPTPANGDNGAYSTNKAADYLGAIDIVIDRAFSDGAVGTGVPVAGSEIAAVLGADKRLYWLIEARAAYTPAAQEVFTFTPEILVA